MEGLIRVTPDKEKAKSILKMVNTTIKMISIIDINSFSSNVTKEYYDVIRELISIIILLDGYKTYGEGAHKRMIDYLNSNHKEFKEYEIQLIDDLRIIRNKIAYDGFFVEKDYIKRKLEDINKIVVKLRKKIDEKLNQA